MSEPWYAYAVFAVALAGAILNVRRSRWCWPLWTVSNAASAVYLASRGLWTQGLLQALFVGLCVWGWRAWRTETRRPSAD